jgi:FKBP-type peptidyl-prolyl cis-trans isomerase FkpA
MTKGKFASLLAVIAGVLIISLPSCDPSKKWEKEEAQSIQTYLLSHSTINYTKKPSGLYYVDDIVGTGRYANTHDTAYILCTGYYLSGTKFYTNIKSAAPHDTLIFAIGEGKMIAGFDEAVTYMNAGGRSMIIVPSYLGYGESGYYMAAYTPLLFTITLCRVAPGAIK